MAILYYFIVFLARILSFAVLIRAFLSWIPISRNNPIIVLIYEITEPVLGPVRRLLPNMGGLDLSPMVALILIQVLERVLLGILGRLI
jgi:YggT family protein